MDDVAKLNLLGIKCPLVVLRTKRFAKANPGKALLIQSDDDSADTDLHAFAVNSGYALTNESTNVYLLTPT